MIIRNIDFEIPDYELPTLLECIPSRDALHYIKDKDLLDELEKRGYKIEI